MMETMFKLHQLDEADAVVVCLQSALKAKNVPQAKAMDIRLCLMEAVHNGFIHGNYNDVAKTVCIKWRLEEKTFCFCVEDEGGGIKKLCTATDELTEEKLLDENGKGLYLIGQISDEIWYNKKGNKIHVKIRW